MKGVKISFAPLFFILCEIPSNNVISISLRPLIKLISIIITCAKNVNNLERQIPFFWAQLDFLLSLFPENPFCCTESAISRNTSLLRLAFISMNLKLKKKEIFTFILGFTNHYYYMVVSSRSMKKIYFLYTDIPIVYRKSGIC